MLFFELARDPIMTFFTTKAIKDSLIITALITFSLLIGLYIAAKKIITVDFVNTKVPKQNKHFFIYCTD